MPRRDGTRRLAVLSLLTAAALIMYVIEQQIPPLVPVPGAKLGLANIITVYAVYRFRAREVFMLLLARIFLGSLIGGTFMSPGMIMSLSGGLFCLAGMLILRRVLDEKHIWLGSIFGAVLHNTGQTAAAVAVTGTFAVVSYYPYLIVLGCIAGAFTGFTAQMIVNRLERRK